MNEKLKGEKPETISTQYPFVDKGTFRAILRNMTQENIQEANQAAQFFIEQVNAKNQPELSKTAKSVFISALLIEYGRLTAHKKEPGQAADPEEKEGD